MFDKRGSGTRRQYLDALHGLLPDLPPEPATVRGHHLPLSHAPRFHPDGRVLLAGDAAASVNPLTGEGIFDAVASGALAGRAALRGADAGAAHRAAMRRTFGRHRRHTTVMARLAARPRFLDAAVSAAAAHQSVFDAAVGLGLERGTVPPRRVRAYSGLLSRYAHGRRLDDAGPAQAIRAGPEASSIATASTATASTARNGARAAGREPDREHDRGHGRDRDRHGHRQPRRHRDHGRRRQQQDRRRRPARRRPDPVGKAAHPRRGVVVEVGQDVREVRPRAQQCPGHRQPPRRQRCARQREHHERGQQAEAHDVGHDGPPRRLPAQVIDPAGRDRDEVDGSGNEPGEQRQRHAGDHGQRGRDPQHRDRDLARHHRLVPASDGAVTGRVEQVVEPADRQLPRQHRGADEHDPAPLRARR